MNKEKVYDKFIEIILKNHGLETSDMENITIVNMDAFKKSCMDVIDELF